MPTPILDPNDPRISPFVTLRGRRNVYGAIEEESVVVGEGKKVVRALLESPLEILSYFSEESYYKEFKSLLDKRNLGEDRRYLACSSLLKEVVGYKMHQGIMALARAPKERAIEALESPIVLLNGLCNGENVGAVIRNAAAFGINSIIIDGKSVSPFQRRSIKVAMGSAFDLSWARSQSLVDAIDVLKKQGVTIVVADLQPDAIPINRYLFPKKFALVLGSEGTGIELQVLKKADAVVTIPIKPSVDSLNVAAASAIILHQALVC